jgi:hypothetical protein
MKGCNVMTIDEKIEALRSNFNMGDDDLLDFMDDVRRHARAHQWQEGAYVYSFCKFYQKDLADVVKFLRIEVAEKTAGVKTAAVSREDSKSQNLVAQAQDERQSKSWVEESAKKAEIEENGGSGPISSTGQNQSDGFYTWLGWLSRAFDGDKIEKAPVVNAEGLPPAATTEFESSGQTAVGYARAVACFFVPCDLAVRLLSTMSARLLRGEL